mmetsp:Transcript_13484/g.13213  ORF Transcript_13484/g.13213 Transcript_13484/m.13213 type:complete len:111 (+) Transcript_13484:1085-1417(+)
MESYQKHFETLFKDEKFRLPHYPYVRLEEGPLFAAIDRAVDKVKRGKALGPDLVPDDYLTKEQVKGVMKQEYKIIFQGTIPARMRCSRGVVVSKTGRAQAEPNDTRLLCI